MSATAPPTRSTSRPPTESSPQRKAFRPIAPIVCPQRQDHPVTSTSALTNASNGQFPSVQRVRLYRVPWTKQLTPIGARSSSKSAGGPRTASISPRLSAPAPKRHKRIVDYMSDYETRYRTTSYTWYRRSDQLIKGNCCETLQITPAWLRSTSIWLRARDHTIAAFRALETIVEEDRNAAPPPPGRCDEYHRALRCARCALVRTSFLGGARTCHTRTKVSARCTRPIRR